MNSSTTVQFSNRLSSANTWVKLEQEAVPFTNKSISYSDLNQMMSRVMAGQSATTYISDACKYLKIRDGVVTVELDFYVWPSQLDLEYSLQAGFGTISEPVAVELTRSFDLIFEGSDSADLGFVFAGEVAPQMPYYQSNGVEFSVAPVFTMGSTTVTSDKPVYTVLRADGIASGFKHTLTMELEKAELDPILLYRVYNYSYSGVSYNHVGFPIAPKLDSTPNTWQILFYGTTTFGVYNSSGALVETGNISTDLETSDFILKKAGWGGTPIVGAYFKFTIDMAEADGGVIRKGYSINNLQAEIIASWVDGGKTQTETLSMDIPECVDSLLSACGEGYENSRWLMNLNTGSEEYFYNVYYSTCTGKVILERWEKNE